MAMLKINACGCWRPCFAARDSSFFTGASGTKLIAEGLTLSMFPRCAGQEAASEFASVSKGGAAIRIYILYVDWNAHAARDARRDLSRRVALRRKFIPILLGLWLVAWLATPSIARSTTARTSS